VARCVSMCTGPLSISNESVPSALVAGVTNTVEKYGHARAEWHKLTDIMIHRPGVEMLFGLLDPYAFLYERAFSMDEAIYEHRELEHVLSQSGAKVLRFKRVAVEIAKENPAIFDEARTDAKRIVKFEGPKAELARKEFSKNVDELDAETIFNIILLRPSIQLKQGKGTRVLFPHPVLNVPLANLYFMRDQQALTDKGFVVGRMSKPQRMMEPSFTGRILQLMGAKIAHQIKPPGTFEGGDFIPAGEFAMIGLGDRTNRNAIKQILDKGLDFNEVAVVHQAAHPLIPGEERDPMINMHLDTYLNLAGQGIAVGCIPLLKRAHVEIYRRRSRGKYTKEDSNTNIHDFLVKRGFKIVPITTLEQMSYASNFLCMKDRQIIAVEVEKVVDKVLKNLERETDQQPRRYGELLRQAKKDYRDLRQTGQFFPHKKEFNDLGVEVTPLMLQEITGGYGGAHCMTCVLNRSG